MYSRYSYIVIVPLREESNGLNVYFRPFNRSKIYKGISNRPNCVPENQVILTCVAVQE